IELGRAGLLIIDLDRHPGQPDGVAAFRAMRGDRFLPPHPITRTASNGFHLYFSQPRGEPLGNSRGNLRKGIDVRGAGGWVVAPGAFHGRGSWRGLAGRPPLDLAYRAGAIPVLPAWLLEVIRPPRRQLDADVDRGVSFYGNGDAWLRGLVRTVADATEGERNH